MARNSDPDEDERQRYVDNHRYWRQAAIGTAIFVFLFAVFLFVRMVLN